MEYISPTVCIRSSVVYRGTSLIKDTPLLGPYSRTTPRALRWPVGRGLFPISEVTLQKVGREVPHLAGAPPGALEILGARQYRCISLTRKRTPLGPYRMPMPRFLGGS